MKTPLQREPWAISNSRTGYRCFVYKADGRARFILADEGGEGDDKRLGNYCRSYYPVVRWYAASSMPRWARRRIRTEPRRIDRP